jgi:hypothetical protein
LFTLPFFLILLVEGVASVGQFIGKKIVKSIALGTLAIIFTLSTATVLWKYYKIGHQNVKGACRFVSAQALSQDTLVSFGAARDLFPFYEGRVIAAKTKADLENALKNASGNVYLLYGYERVLRTSSDFNFIKNNFRRLKVFDGMYMDSDCRDGEIFVEIAEKK